MHVNYNVINNILFNGIFLRKMSFLKKKNICRFSLASFFSAENPSSIKLIWCGLNINICNYSNQINPYPAKLNNLNFQPLEVVPRYRDPQLQVAENTDICLIRHKTFANFDV